MTKFLTVWAGHPSILGIQIFNELDLTQIQGRRLPQDLLYSLPNDLTALAKAEMKAKGWETPIGAGYGSPSDSGVFAYLRATTSANVVYFNVYDQGAMEQIVLQVRALNVERQTAGLQPIAVIFSEVGMTGAQVSRIPPSLRDQARIQDIASKTEFAYRNRDVILGIRYFELNNQPEKPGDGEGELGIDHLPGIDQFLDKYKQVPGSSTAILLRVPGYGLESGNQWLAGWRQIFDKEMGSDGQKAVKSGLFVAGMAAPLTGDASAAMSVGLGQFILFLRKTPKLVEPRRRLNASA